MFDGLDEILDDVDLMEQPETHPDNVWCNICQSTCDTIVREFELEETVHEDIVVCFEYEYTCLGCDDDDEGIYYM